jgi:RNA polymerase sigma factor
MLFFTSGQESLTDNIISRLEKVQNGDKLERERVIEDYKPFIIKQVSQACGKFVDIYNCEEYSIGLLAFNEAIDSFQIERNRNFFSFAKIVIKRRLIDFMRKNSKVRNEISISVLQQAENDGYLDTLQADEQLDEARLDRKQEIAGFVAELSCFKIKLEDLVQLTPKHEDSRQMAFNISRVLLDNSKLRNHLFSKRNLPIKELADIVDVSRKTLERHRKYIIAISVLLCGNYVSLQEYLGL